MHKPTHITPTGKHILNRLRTLAREIEAFEEWKRLRGIVDESEPETKESNWMYLDERKG